MNQHFRSYVHKNKKEKLHVTNTTKIYVPNV